MIRPISALSLAALTAMLAAPAWADCAPPDFGLVCTEADADGLDVRDDGLVVEVRPGASVADPGGDAIAVGDGARVLNQGSIAGGDDAVVGGSGLAVENEGSIAAAGGRGVDAGDEATLANREGATIEAEEEGVRLGLDAFVANDGEIESGEADGVVIGGGTILNSGTGAIRSLAGTGVVLGPDAVLDNAGVVGGLVGVLGSGGNAEQTVFNEGAILGEGGTAIDLGDGSDLVVAVLGGEIDGATLLGEGDDALLFHIDPGAVASADFGLFDGGPGFDEVRVNDFTSDALSAEAVAEGFRVSLMNGATSLVATLANFESFAFDDATLGAAEVGGAVPAPIPLPAGWPLLGAALAGLGLLRARRAVSAPS